MSSNGCIQNKLLVVKLYSRAIPPKIAIHTDNEKESINVMAEQPEDRCKAGERYSINFQVG